MIRHPSLSSALLLFSLAVVPRLATSPPSSPTSARHLPPLPPLLTPLSLSLSTARPTHIRSPVVFLPAWCPRYSALSSAFPSSRSASSSSFLWSRGGCGCPASFWGYHFPGYLAAMRVLLPLPLLLTLLPPLGLPLSRHHHPFHLRFWVLQRILCFLLLLVFQGVIPVSLDSSFGRGLCALLLLLSFRLLLCFLFSDAYGDCLCFTSAGILSLLLAPCASDVSLPSATLLRSWALLSSGWFVAGLPSSSGHPVTGVLLRRLASWALQCYFL